MSWTPSPLAIAFGNAVSRALPGLRVGIGKLTGEDTSPYKQILAENKRKSAAPLTVKDAEGNLRLNPEGVEATTNLALGFTGAEGGNIIKEMAKSKVPSFIKTTLKKNFRLADDVIEEITPQIVRSTNPEEVNQIINLSRKTGQVQQVGLPVRGTSGTISSARGILSQGVPTAQSPSQGLLTSLDNTPFNPESYVFEQVTKREVARLKDAPSLIKKTTNFLDDVKSKLVDFTSPIEDTLYRAQQKSKFSLLPEADIHNQIDRVLRSPTIAGQFAKDNGLVKLIQSVDDPNFLDQYLIAKHAVELDTRGITTGRTLVKDQALVKALAPKYEAQAQMVGNYSKKLLDYATDTGLVKKEVADMLKKKYPDYVPFNRVFSGAEELAGKSGKAVASLSKQTAVQSIKGSIREIESPLQSLLSKTDDVIKQGEKNKAAQLLASYEKLPGNPFQLKELTGFEETLKNGKVRDFKVKLEADKNTFSFFENGKKRVYQTTPEIAEAAKALNVQQLNILGKIFALPTRIARLGITGINLPFVAANVVRDQATAFINSSRALKTSIANPVNFLKSLFAAVGHGKLYDEVVRAGAAGTSYDIARNQAVNTFAKIRSGRSIPSKILYTVKHPSELLRAVENIVSRGEELTRIQQYRGTKEALLKEGFDEKNAVIGAARAARDTTVNFARRGEWGTVLNSAFLYLNASIQGTRTLLKSLQTRPVATSAKIAITALFPVAVATTWNLSDPERKKAYEDIPEYEKENNIIIIPPNPTQDEKGHWNVIKIPLSQEINNLVGLARKPIEQAHGLDPVTFDDFAQALIGTVSPIKPTKGSILSAITPQAIKPTIEAAVNRNLFTGYPQVSQGLERLSPEKQIKEGTSKFAIALGQQLGVSPIKIDAFIKGTFGGVGQQLTGQQTVIDAVFARFGKATGGAVENKFYEKEKIEDQKKADLRADFKKSVYDKVQQLSQTNPEEAKRVVEEMSVEEYAIYKSIRTSERAKHTEELRHLLKIDPVDAVTYLRSQTKEEQERLINLLTDAEYEIYQQGKAGPEQPNKSFEVAHNYADDGGKAYMEYDQWVIQPRREKDAFGLTPSSLSQTPKKTLKGFLLDLKDKIPFFESRMGKNMKEDALNSYAFTDEMKKLLREESFIKDTSPMFDLALGISKNDDEVRVGRPKLPYGGVSNVGRVADYLPFGREILDEDVEDGKLNPLGKKLIKRLGPNRIEIKTPDTLTVAHELIHAIVDKRGVVSLPEEFNQRWDKAAQSDERLRAVDRVLKESGLYEGHEDDEWGTMNERMAYLGAMLGVGGLEAFPEEFKKDYKGIFQ